MNDNQIHHAVTDEGRSLWYVTWGSSPVDLSQWPGSSWEWVTPTRHEVWSERINWWLADRVEGLAARLRRLGQWLSDDLMFPLNALEDRLRGFD